MAKRRQVAGIRAAKRSHVGEGAALSAPTAPHATFPAPPQSNGQRGGSRGEARSGPERFWMNDGVRAALVVSLVLSIAVHYVLAPITLFPEKSLEFRDIDGDVAIPIDLLQDDPPAPALAESPVSPAAEAQTPPGNTPAAGAGLDAGIDGAIDASTVRDAAVLRDA